MNNEEPKLTGIVNNDNNQVGGVVPNNTPVDSVNPTVVPTNPTIEQPVISQPEPTNNDFFTVAPPVVSNNNQASMNEDNRILKPIVDEPKVEETPTEVRPHIELDTDSGNYNKKEENTNRMENVKMKRVDIEYKPPGKFKTFIMILMFIIILATIVFLPEINLYISQYTSHEEEVEEEEIMNGTLMCSVQTKDDKYNLTHSYEFKFEQKEVTSIDYTFTTMGDKALDGEQLEAMRTSCMNLSKELDSKEIGVEVDCDRIDGTVTIYQSIDFDKFDKNEAKTLFDKYSIKLMDFSANSNITTIEKNLKSSNYICEMTKSEE